MRSSTMVNRLLFGILITVSWSGVGRLVAQDSSYLRQIFAQPPREYSTGPLWTWNDLLTEDQVVSTLRDLAAQHVRQVWVHPQPGLMTPYLSDDWFRLWKVALDEAKRLDISIWIYDENSYPSGFAGGWVPETMPESRGRGLHFREEKQPGALTPDILAVFRLHNDAAEDVTAELRSGQTLPEAGYLTAVIARAPETPWNAGRSYVDLLYPGVTDKFLEITLEPYRRHFGADFGDRIPGVFTDEPSLLPAGGLPWTEDLADQFQRRWGYSLLEHLPGLVRPIGDWRRLRHNYFQVLLDLYIERWAKPYFEYCERNHLELTGHYLEHEWPKLIHTPDYMALQAWEHRPGIDVLMNQYQELPHAQFGNVRIVKEIASVANQLGRRRTLSETYAGSGHEIRFEEMKRQGDWQMALGLNTLNECLSHVTIRGVRKGNWPRTLSYHNPWWEAYHTLEDYFTRLSAALSQGRRDCRILVLEPTTTAWMYQNDENLQQLGLQFQMLLNNLERSQVEYDLGSEDILARHGSAEESCLMVGECRYPIIVLPPFTENLNATTVQLLAACLKSGTTVLCCGEPPGRVDGVASATAHELSQSANWKRVSPSALPLELRTASTDGFAIERADNDRGLLFHLRRQFDDGQLVFLVNTSMEDPARGLIRSPAQGIEEWNALTGGIRPFTFTRSDRGVETRFDIPPCGSLLLFLSNRSLAPAAEPLCERIRIEPATLPSVRRLAPNVLVLDYLELKMRDQETGLLHCREATRQLFSRNGFKGDPWFEAVQFADEHIRRTFPPESSFEATYRFTIEEDIPASLRLVVERPDLYETIVCNQRIVVPIADSWWLDHSFGQLDIRDAARIGENVVTLRAARFTPFHELEPAYVLGDFRVHPAAKGFTIVPPEPLTCDSEKGWNEQGHPFYSGGVGYEEEFDIPDLVGTYHVELGAWHGSVAKIIVNGQFAGYVGWRPWECNVTPHLHAGRNRIEVVVIGTLRNTLGPFHAGPPQGIVTPYMFNQAPVDGQPSGTEYSVIRYGLFEPFTVTWHKPPAPHRE